MSHLVHHTYLYNRINSSIMEAMYPQSDTGLRLNTPEPVREYTGSL